MRKSKLNNQGSTLLTIIIILAFIGILGSMMLSVTLTNLRMKIIERKSKENFYTCEITLDEITTGLHELTVKRIRELYEDEVLKNITSYISLTEEELNNKLKEMVVLSLIDELGNTSTFDEMDLLNGILVEAENNQIFDDYLRPIPDDVIRSIGIGKINIESKTDMIGMKSPIGIIVSEVDVKMVVNDFESRIRTDIVLELSDFSFDDGLQNTTYRMEQPYKEYALIADGRIVSDHGLEDGSSGKTSIEGSVYAGKGITIGSQSMDYHNVVINGDDIITRGDITVKDTGKLVIDGTVWADNINIETTYQDTTSITKATSLDIDGICLVKDDLTLNGNYSKVSLRGAYAGFTSTGVSVEEDYSLSSLGSSIIVNGFGSSLDLSGLSSLILAGRAYVSVDDSKESTTKVTDILTGESLGIKSNQKAYLIPGRFIKDIGHNPVTSKDITDYNIPQVDLTAPNPEGYIDYMQYVDLSHPFKIASKQTVEGNQSAILYYYYLGFASGKQADDYLREYITRDEYSLDNTSPLMIKNITSPNPAISEIIAAGNIMSYNADAVGEPKIDIIPGISDTYASDVDINNVIKNHELSNPAYSGNGINSSDTVGDLNGLYNKISHLLSLDSSRGYQYGDKVVESTTVLSSTVDLQNWLDRYPTYEGFDYYGGDIEFNINQIDGKIIVVNGNAKIYEDFTGLMVVNGDVYIGNNVEINGMILSIDSEIDPDTGDEINKIELGDYVSVNGRLASMGDIILGSDNTFTASYIELETIFTEHVEVLKYIFRNLEQSILGSETVPADNLVDLSTMIYYRNWRRE